MSRLFSTLSSMSDWKAGVFAVQEDNRTVQVLEIIDLDLGKMSVTNDIENVVMSIDLELDKAFGGNVSVGDYAVIYRDSTGAWDEVVLDDVGNFKKFAALPRGRCQTELRAEAVLRLLERKLGPST